MSSSHANGKCLALSFALLAVSTERWFGTQSVWLFSKNSLNPPFRTIQKSTSCDALPFRIGGFAQQRSAQVYLHKRSVQTERWFDTQSVWLFFKQPNPPCTIQKSTPCDVLPFRIGGFAQQRSAQVYLHKRSVQTERWFDTQSVWLFFKQPNPPCTIQKSTPCDVLPFRIGGFAQQRSAQVYLHKRSVQTERWFDTQSVWLFFKQPNPPCTIQKSTPCDVLFCWWRGVDSNHRSH